MRKFFTLGKLCLLWLLTLLANVSSGQTIGWNFTSGTATPSTTAANITCSDLVQGNNNGTTTFITSVSTSSGYTGVSGGNNAGLAARTGALSTAVNGSPYIEFTLTPAAGYIPTLTAISFGCRSTSTGPTAYTLRSSLDGYGTDLATGAITANSTWALKTNSNLSISGSAGTPIIFRIYGYSGAGSASANTANFRFDDINVSVTAAPPVISSNANLSALSLSQGTLSPAFTSSTTSYSTVVGNAVSSVTLNFTKAQANATVTASVNGGSFGNPSVVFPLSVGNNLIDIKVTAQDGTTIKDYIIAINRAAPALPILTVSSGLADFGNVCINTIAGSNSFTIDGTDLDGTNISIALFQGFTFSETINGVYTNTLIFPAGNNFTGKIIYVKFTPTSVQSYNGNIMVSGGGAASLSVPVSATGINTTAAVSTVGNIVTGTAATLSGSISSIGCTAVTLYGFEYSTTSGFSNGTGIQVTASNLSGGGFSKTVSGLTAGTTYYFKAFATNNGGTSYGAQQSFITSTVTPVVMASQPLLRYTENFTDITNWSNNFISGIGANRFSSALLNSTGTIPDGVKITVSTTSFQTVSTSSGVQKGTGNILLLSTGSTDNSSSAAIDFYMDFTGVNAGTLSFDWASVNNSTGNRNGSLRVYASNDGITFTELVSADVLNFSNNIPSTGTVNSISLPASFNNSPTARLRFYYHNGTGGATGSRPKISIDNLTVTGVASTPCATPSAGATSLTFGTITETSVQGNFIAATPAVNEYLVIMSTNSTLTSNPLDGQTYTIGDNVGDGTVIAKGSSLSFMATGLTGATNYSFFIFPVNSVCTGGPKYLTTSVLTNNATTFAGLPGCTAPSVQPNNLVSTASVNSVQGSFTATVADEYLVLQSTSMLLTGTPVNGAVYKAGDVLGNAMVIQKSNGTTFTASNLSPATQYYYFIFSINSQGCVNGPAYNTVSPLSGSQTTLPLPVCITPSAQPENISFNTSNSSVTGTFNGAGSGYNYLVVMSTTPSLSATPVDNIDYIAGSSLGGGTVVSNNTSTSFIANNLTSSTQYYFFVFSANQNCSGGTKYLVVSPLTGNATTTNAPLNNYYFGNLHAHSDYSDGNKDHPGFTPADDYNYAMSSQGMDFLGISEHNHFSSVDNPGNELANYHLGVAQAAAFNSSHTNFLALYGMEWGVISGGGHVVVYGDGMGNLFGWESNVNGTVGPNYDVYVPKSTYTGPDGLFKTVTDYRANNTFATLAHPNSTDFNNLANSPYDAVADDAISGAAVESGPATSTNTSYSNPGSSMFYLWYYQKLLSKGYHLGPTIDHDNHNTTFGRTTNSRTAVIAPSLTQANIVKAVRDMHFYATQDIDAKVDFTINTRIMGSIFEDRNAPSITVNLTDPTTATSNALIRVMFGIPGSDILPVVIDSVFASSLSYVDNSLPNHATGYYYIDITNGATRIVTSPIWYTRTCAASSEFTVAACDSYTWSGTTYISSTTATKVFTTAAGCDSTVTLHLTVNYSPASATIQAAGGNSGCPGKGVLFTTTTNDGGNGAISSYQWLLEGNAIAGATGTGFTALQSGNYSVKVFNINNCSVISNVSAATIEDHTSPVPVIPNLPVISGECSVTLVAPTATDNCDTGLLNGTTFDAVSYTQQGVYTVIWTYADANGNTATQTQTVIVHDATAPVLVGVPQSASVACDNVPAVATVTATDNCDASPVVSLLETSTQDAAVNVSGHYNYTITRTWTATDANGNSSVSAQTITVTDTKAPVITVPGNINQSNDAGLCSAVVTFSATATDNCSPVALSYSPASGSVFSVGSTTVTVTASDVSGNATTADFIVTITDTEKPIVTAPANISVPNDGGQCGAAIIIGDATTSDNCGVAGVTNDAPEFFPVGTTTVTWTVIDIHGNSITAVQTVTVSDKEKPTITAPANISVPNDGGQCGAAIIIGDATTSDNCGVAGVTNDAPEFFPVGTTTVTWTVTDIHGNSNSATQTVTVSDKEKPTITAPANINVFTDAGKCGAAVNLGNGATGDNCGVAGVTNDAPIFFPVGTTKVIWTVTDIHGNSNSATQTVTVSDKEKPTITAPVNISVPNDRGQCGAAISIGNAVTGDNCEVAGITNNAPEFFPVGTTYVTWTVTDIHGNSNTALQTVTVTDNEKPYVITKSVSVVLVNGIATITAGMVNNVSTDNCGITSFSVAPSIFHCTNIGSNTVTLTATDKHGNVSTGTALVTVVGEMPGCNIKSVPTSAVYTGGNPKNLYLGFGAQSTVLQVTFAGTNTTTGYTYLWTGDATGMLSSTTSAMPVFTPTASGYYAFTVTTTNNYGCITTCTISICVSDIRVPGTNGSKVYVCHTPTGNAVNPQTISISVNAVAAHLSNHANDKLGSCNMAACTSSQVAVTSFTNTQSVTSEKAVAVITPEEELKVTVMPNPSTTFFTLKLESKYETPVSMRVLDAGGRVVDAKSQIGANSTIQLGQGYSSGTYYAEMIQGTKRKMVQLIKAKG